MVLKALVILVLLLGGMAAGAGATAFIDDELVQAIQASPAEKEFDVIVRLQNRPDVSTTQIRKRSRSHFVNKLKADAKLDRDKLKAFFKSHPPKKKSDLWVINGFSLTAGAATIRTLSQHPAVYSITPNRTFELPQPACSGSSSATWNIAQINAQILWSFGYAGSEIVVAVVDSGADAANPHLQSSYRGGSNSWFDTNGVYASPYDGNGHGTRVLGIILGSNDIDSVLGVAPSAKWIAARIFDQEGQADVDDAHQAFQWLLDPDGDSDTDDAPHIVNCSWGLVSGVDECVTELQEDVSVLRQAGIAVVFAAGNENVNPLYPSSVSPANYPDSVSVGAVDDSSLIAPSSSRGPSACDGSIYPKLVAPGVSIETCDLSYGGLFDQHVYVDGTSFSTPHMTAAYALLMEAFADANHFDVEQALIASAVDLGDTGADNVYGHGLIDIYAAYRFLAVDYSAADFDHNHTVDTIDLLVLVDDWLNPDCSPQSPCRGDLNNDDDVDLRDFAAFSEMFLD